MERFGSTTNLFGFMRLPKVVIERGDIRMQVRQELSQLCFLCDDIRFKSQFLFFTPTEAFLKPLYELDPASDLAGIKIRKGWQGFGAIERFFSLVHPIDKDEKIAKRNFKCG